MPNEVRVKEPPVPIIIIISYANILSSIPKQFKLYGTEEHKKKKKWLHHMLWTNRTVRPPNKKQCLRDGVERSGAVTASVISYERVPPKG